MFVVFFLLSFFHFLNIFIFIIIIIIIIIIIAIIVYVYVFSASTDLAEKRIRFLQGLSLVFCLYFTILYFCFVEL